MAIESQGRLHYPDILEPQIVTALWQISREVISAQPQPKIPLENETAITTSLANFAQEMNAGEVTKQMNQFIKPSHYPQKGNFVISAGKYGDEHFADDNHIDGWFPTDGTHSIHLGFRDDIEKSILEVATMSFSFGNGINSYRDSFKFRFSEPLPIILQLQGPHHNQAFGTREFYEKAINIVNQYRWEQALIMLLAEWATHENIPAIYLLPSSLNMWRNDKNAQRFHIRYDVSAQRCGFSMQDNGLWGLSLLGYQATDTQPTNSPKNQLSTPEVEV